MNEQDLDTVPSQNIAQAQFRTSQGIEMVGRVRHLTRSSVVFDVFEPDALLAISEALTDFKVTGGQQLLYSGRAVVGSIVNTGLSQVCEAALDEYWPEAEMVSQRPQNLPEEFQNFLHAVQGALTVKAEFKTAVADLQTVLSDLKGWLDQVELGIRSDPRENAAEREARTLVQLKERVVPWLAQAFDRFEQACANVDAHAASAYSFYAKRQLHPLVLSAPFMYRTYRKPLGYAGDYEMVNMMTRDAFEGSSVFSKLLNSYFLSTPPVQAHRNRIDYLVGHLLREILRVSGRGARVFSLGCGPAREVQRFLEESAPSLDAHFTLLDFNDETLIHLKNALEQINSRRSGRAEFTLLKRSIAQFIKESSRPNSKAGTFDLIYCAGLFDYLPDSICSNLLTLLYRRLNPGGLLLATNVDPSNPCRRWMEYAVDWHLIYRDHRALMALCPAEALKDQPAIRSELTGINISLEIRKPAHD